MATQSQLDKLLADYDSVSQWLERKWAERDAAIEKRAALSSKGNLAALLDIVKSGGTVQNADADLNRLNQECAQGEAAAAQLRDAIQAEQNRGREQEARASLPELKKLAGEYAAALIAVDRISQRFVTLGEQYRAYSEILPPMNIPRIASMVQDAPHSAFSLWLRSAVGNGLIPEPKNRKYRYA
jgi:hypothetical protein